MTLSGTSRWSITSEASLTMADRCRSARSALPQSPFEPSTTTDVAAPSASSRTNPWPDPLALRRLRSIRTPADLSSNSRPSANESLPKTNTPSAPTPSPASFADAIAWFAPLPPVAIVVVGARAVIVSSLTGKRSIAIVWSTFTDPTTNTVRSVLLADAELDASTKSSSATPRAIMVMVPIALATREMGPERRHVLPPPECRLSAAGTDSPPPPKQALVPLHVKCVETCRWFFSEALGHH